MKNRSPSQKSLLGHRHPWMRTRTIFVTLGLGLVLVIIWVTAANFLVTKAAQNRCFQDVRHIPYHRVGLLLGTAKHLAGGQPNPHYVFRVQAAETILREGKIEKLIISGDNRFNHYNEPEMMRQDLISRGIAPNRLVCDFAGLRTLDSVVRAKEIFGQNALTIISQHEHNQRAIFIASYYGIHAVGFDAQTPDFQYEVTVHIREIFARARCLVDVLVRKNPRHLGSPIAI